MSTLRCAVLELAQAVQRRDFFLYKRKFLFFELEFRFTTAVFCLTHFCIAWQTLLSSDTSHPQNADAAVPGPPLPCVVTDDVYL